MATKAIKKRPTPKKKPPAKKPARSKAAPPKKPPKKPPAPPAPPPPPPPDPGYEARKERSRAAQAVQSQKGRDIGAIPDIADPARRAACRKSLKLFCETYNPDAFYLPWSDDQLEEIARLEEVALYGALHATAAPRGDGKTTRCRMAALWAVAYSLRFYVPLIGANATKAKDNLASIKTRIRFLPLFAADFPEISYPAQRVGGVANRAAAQLCLGAPTLIEWGQDRIILPTVSPPANWPKAWPLRADGMVPTSGSILSATGLTADGIRGSVITLPSGAELRPDMVLLDDPQTPESARSPSQNINREQLVSADVLGMAGPGKTISAMMPCTVIAPGDFIDNMLDRSKHPLWRGRRTKLMRSMPKNLDAWEEYFEVYRRCVQAEPPDLAEANRYYLDHRAVLDAGAEAAWPARKLPTEVSAVQHAMHLYCRDKKSFWAEYQNEPQASADLGEAAQLTEDVLVRKLNRVPPRAVPRECNRLTAFVDVQQEALFWAVCGWTDRFGGAVVDHGTFPAQNRAVFEARDLPKKLSHIYPKMDARTRIYTALAELVPAIAARAHHQEGAGGTVTPSMTLIDSGYETEAVHDFLSRSPLKAVLRPSKGRGIKADNKPMNEYRKEPGDVTGWNWRVDAQVQGKGRFVSFDTNAWKSFVADGLLSPAGAPGAIYLPGAELRDCPLLTIHLLSEYRVPTYSQDGRRVEVWKRRPDGGENHWWDCVVGCAVAASVSGLTFSASGEAAPAAAMQRPVKLSEMKAAKEREKRRG